MSKQQLLTCGDVSLRQLPPVPVCTSKLFGTRGAAAPHLPTRSPPSSPHRQPAPTGCSEHHMPPCHLHPYTPPSEIPPAESAICQAAAQTWGHAASPPVSPQYQSAPAGCLEQGELPAALTTALPLGPPAERPLYMRTRILEEPTDPHDVGRHPYSHPSRLGGTAHLLGPPFFFRLKIARTVTSAANLDVSTTRAHDDNLPRKRASGQTRRAVPLSPSKRQCRHTRCTS